MPRKKNSILPASKRKLDLSEQPKERQISIVEVPETGEYEIAKKANEKRPAKKVRFPKDPVEQYQMTPDDFAKVQDAIEELKLECRTEEVFADSLESYLGYDSLLRVMSKYYSKRVAFYTSPAGGSLSIEEARKEAYRRNITNEEAVELFEKLMRMPTENISFWHLMELCDNSPAMAENVWEMIKREAGREFESGHRAAAAFEPADYMTDAWNRASYLGLRESLCAEWKPTGGIELKMIDGIAQAWLMLQHWTEESVRRAKTRPREENPEFYNWKRLRKQTGTKQWDGGYWDVPTVTEQNAVEHAAQMADRWQRMYFRAVRNLRDWRRYTPQVTINNTQQINIATSEGQQLNISGNPFKTYRG